jgi:hypothetical protein
MSLCLYPYVYACAALRKNFNTYFIPVDIFISDYVYISRPPKLQLKVPRLQITGFKTSIGSTG